MGEENAEHFVACFWEQFLRITGIGHGLAFLRVTKGFALARRLWEKNTIGDTLEPDVPQYCIRDVPYKDPPNLEDTFPFVRRPDSTATGVVDGSQHFGHTAEMTTKITHQPHFEPS